MKKPDFRPAFGCSISFQFRSYGVTTWKNFILPVAGTVTEPLIGPSSVQVVALPFIWVVDCNVPGWLEVIVIEPSVSFVTLTEGPEVPGPPSNSISATCMLLARLA